MRRVRLYVEHSYHSVYDIPIPSSLMCGKSTLEELSDNEYLKLHNYIEDHAGDFWVEEIPTDQALPSELVLLAECKLNEDEEKCMECRARLACLIDHA